MTGQMSHQRATVTGQHSHHRQENTMHVFVTGGTGTIGTPVVAELLAHGHTVTGLARSDRSTAELESAGAAVVRGDLSDLDVLRDGARGADGVISLAFGSDYSTAEALERSIAEESAATAALGAVLVGTGKPLVVVSGTPWVPGRASVESDPLPHEGAVAGRAVTVEAALALATEGVRPVAVRLPRTVHADGLGGFAGLLADAARRSGVAGYPGDGTQRWPAVHARDAAVLFRLALESAPAGTAWHAVADEGDAVIDIAAVVGRRLGLPVQQVPDEAFGPFGAIFATDQPSSSAVTREALGWSPTHPSLLADLELLRP
jgi:nucleoside-diphosphate-sugar epimerase